jgi:glutamate carboxypeptidase
MVFYASSTSMDLIQETTELLPFFKRLEPQMLQWLAALINLDTPSNQKPALDALGQRLGKQFQECGARTQLVENREAGNHLIVRFLPESQEKKQILILGHMDTVWEVGESRRRPARVEDGKIFGPGAFDMRGGLTLMLALASYLSQQKTRLTRPVTILIDSDEEVGSQTSRALIESEARQSEAVLVLEPCLPGGALKTCRKGVGRFVISAQGMAAHSGVDYHKGVSAIWEIAHQVLDLYKLNDFQKGTTINVGTVEGGSCSNVIADHAKIKVDLRVSSVAEGERLAKHILQLKPKLEGARLKITGGINRPPLERTDQIVQFFHRARSLAAELGIDLKEGSTGGASDGCFTAALGIPTLDGLGPDGAGPHALHEHVLIASLAPRAALLTQLVLRL